MKPKNAPRENPGDRGLTRRGFLTTVGTGAIGVAVSGQMLAAPHPSPDLTALKPDEATKVSLRINERRYDILVAPRWTLLDALREKIGMTGAKAGCGRGECGACTVLIDDRPRYACMTLALEARDTVITTVEGLMRGEALGSVQTAFVETDAFQ